MRTVNMHEAKTLLSSLVRDLRTGAEREIIVAIDGTPAAKLVPYGRGARRTLGIDQGLVEIADDFDAPNAAIAASFEADG
jgi:antitoxin (DNA-binding transcriptional repressor) of toxin-antitoxin stability system